MEQRLQACSHYCEHKKAKKYVPEHSAWVYLNKHIVMSMYYLLKTKSGCNLYNALKRLMFPVYKRYYSNNNLGIFLTTSCNLSCLNCQTSARQAPANDFMSVGQMKGVVNEAINLKYYWNRIYLTGGEPTLHPHLFEILDIVKIYKDFNPGCVIILETNGVGNKAQAVLNKLPDWVLVYNSNKIEGKNTYGFSTYNVAPKDTLEYKFSDFSKGCKRLVSSYGLCASMYGYYPCSPCMNVDRVFAFDVGIKKLSLVNEKALREQMRILCSCCGWFKERHIEKVLIDVISESWEKAFAEYRKQKPKLSQLNSWPD